MSYPAAGFSPYAPNQGAYPQAPSGPANRNGIIIAAAAGIIFLVSVLAYFLNWQQATLSFNFLGSGSKISASMNGFGLGKAEISADLMGQGDNAAGSEWVTEYLVLAIAVLVLAIAGAGLALFTRFTVATTVTFLGAGVLQLVAVVLNLTNSDMDYYSEMPQDEAAVFDALVSENSHSIGAGTYIALLCAVLFIALGAWVLYQSRQPSRGGLAAPAGYAPGYAQANVPGWQPGPGYDGAPFGGPQAGGQYGEGQPYGQFGPPAQPQGPGQQFQPGEQPYYPGPQPPR